MIKVSRIPFLRLIASLSDAVDLVSPVLVDHHKRVAYIALRLAEELGLSRRECSDLVVAGLLHDSGTLSLAERLDCLDFDYLPGAAGAGEHAYMGYALFRQHDVLQTPATLIRYHHITREEALRFSLPEDVSKPSLLLHLADRIDILVDHGKQVIGQRREILERLAGPGGDKFLPDHLEAFKRLAEREEFWLDLVSPSIRQIVLERAPSVWIQLNIEHFKEMAELFCRLIDYRSRFTATHSSGVAASARSLAGKAGFCEQECRMMEVAGFLHDLGKLAVPSEILEKPGKLTPEEFGVIRSHTYHTFRVLESLDETGIINRWASSHHERLDGRGYPFRQKGEVLCLGARIMAVADVFTAITEDRPYRDGMPAEKALGILENMSEGGALDADIVALLKTNFDAINEARATTQARAREQYTLLMEETADVRLG